MSVSGTPASSQSDVYLDALASAEPTPGGGSAAATVAATGAALVAMVARITAGAERFAAAKAQAQTLAAAADAARAALLEARAADERAYQAVVVALALPRVGDNERAVRAERLQSVLANAAAEPLRIAQLAADVVGLAEDALALDNRNLASDLGCAAAFAEAAVAAAALNVRVNHAYLRDDDLRAHQQAALATLERETSRRVAHVRAAVERTLARSG